MDLFSQPSPNQHYGKSKLHEEEIGIELLGVGLSSAGACIPALGNKQWSLKASAGKGTLENLG